MKHKDMKEWIYRRGCERTRNNFKPNWWQTMCFWPIMDIMCWDYRHFVELINDNGDIRRIYVNE